MERKGGRKVTAMIGERVVSVAFVYGMLVYEQACMVTRRATTMIW